MKKNTIICISREYGSGGRTVGELLSEKLGIPFYDKEILSRVAKESDMSEEFVKNHKKFSFRNLLERQGSKMEIIVTFLAVLEMMKQGILSVEQEDTFGDIMITSSLAA